jgi:AcrR family transcriptional regulator
MLHEISAQRSPEETRNRILAATRALFARKGRRGTTTREIAELAGVNEATLFRHFGHKDALIEACAKHYCAAPALQELVENLSGDVQTDLRRIAAGLYDRMEQVRDMIVMTLAEEEDDSAVGDAAWRAPAEIRQMLTEYMAGRVAAGELAGDPRLLAKVFVGMIFANVIARKKFPQDAFSPGDVIDFQIHLFLNGARRKKSS